MKRRYAGAAASKGLGTEVLGEVVDHFCCLRSLAELLLFIKVDGRN